MHPDRIELASFARSSHQLSYSATVRGHTFSTSLWYSSVDFLTLEEAYGTDFLESVYFHIVAFDVNKLVSLAPASIDFGRFNRFVTPEFADLWKHVVHNVWAQWRFENGLPDYRIEIEHVRGRKQVSKISLRANASPSTLAFCGGGKDSLLAMRVLERSGIPYDSFAYSHSVYGDHATQHALIDGLRSHTSSANAHRVYVYDDFLTSPVLTCSPELGIKSLTAAETPSSLFLAIPLALTHGYQHFVLAHEKSADVGNLVWDRTGESINHQWGKSLDAEILLSRYIRENVLEDLSYFSILKPLQDAVIFPSLARDFEALRATHSCNVRKPWCERCPKCAYVWLNYAAYYPKQIVEDIFESNIADHPANVRSFRMMLGLENHTPFECIGQIDETKLAFELCWQKGYRGAAFDVFREAFPNPIRRAVVAPLLSVDTDHSAIPRIVAHRVNPILEDLGRMAAANVSGFIRY